MALFVNVQVVNIVVHVVQRQSLHYKLVLLEASHLDSLEVPPIFISFS